MTRYKVGYFVGSLATASINRLLAKALVRLAPAELEMTEIPFKDLPLYSYDYDAKYPPVATEFKTTIAAVDAVLFATPEYNPVNSWCAQERHRLGQQAVWTKRVHEEAVGRDRGLAWKDRHGRGTATPAQHPRVLQLAADELYRSLHSVRARIDHRGRRCHTAVN
jgi:hypothetical protein